MTSLSKIYSRAKAANKGKTATANVTASPFATKTDSTSPSPNQAAPNKNNMKIISSIFQSVQSDSSDSGTGARTVSGGIKSALATFTGAKSNINYAIKNGGVPIIHFNDRNSGTNTDQYLTVKPRIPSRVSSDPIKVSKQTDKELEEQKNKAWSNDVLTKALKSWPADKVAASSSISVVVENEKSVRLYDFSSTPTGVTSSSMSTGGGGGDTGSKSSSSRHSRHSSIGPESPARGSFSMEKTVGSVGGDNKNLESSAGSIISDSGGRTVFSFGSSSTGSGGSQRSTSESIRKGNLSGLTHLSSKEASGGRRDENPETDKSPVGQDGLKAAVDLREGCSSPIEYVEIDSIQQSVCGSEDKMDRDEENTNPRHNSRKYADMSLDSSQNGGNDSNDDDDTDGYGPIDKYNSMRVGRTASVASDVMGSKTSFTSVYESTRSESPPIDSLYKSQQRTYTSGVSSSNSSAWSGSVYKTGIAPPLPVNFLPSRAAAIKQSPIPPKEVAMAISADTVLELTSPYPLKPSVAPSNQNYDSKVTTDVRIQPRRDLDARSPDLMGHNRDGKGTVDSKDGAKDKEEGHINYKEVEREHLHSGSAYRSGSSRSRSRSAGKWRADQGISFDLTNNDDKSAAIGDNLEEEDEDEALAGGYDTT